MTYFVADVLFSPLGSDVRGQMLGKFHFNSLYPFSGPSSGAARCRVNNQQSAYNGRWPEGAQIARRLRTTNSNRYEWTSSCRCGRTRALLTDKKKTSPSPETSVNRPIDGRRWPPYRVDNDGRGMEEKTRFYTRGEWLKSAGR
jgi:hypothetical protein